MSTAAAIKKIIPLLDRVVVRRVKPVEKTASGIFIPEKAQENINRGVVIAVGPGSKDFSMTLKEGDSVVLPSYGGLVVKSSSNGDEDLHVFRESDIPAKYEQ